VLAHPELVDLVVELHALGLAAKRPGLDDLLLDLVVPVEGERLAEEPAKEAVGIRVVGAEAADPQVLFLEARRPEFSVGRAVVHAEPDLGDLLGQELRGRHEPRRDEHLELGEPSALRIAGLGKQLARGLGVVLGPDAVRVAGHRRRDRATAGRSALAVHVA
jgi:hypothetical protein